MPCATGINWLWREALFACYASAYLFGRVPRNFDADAVVLCTQSYYRDVEHIDDLKRAVQFPKLEPPPSDFLVQMENYAKEAPRMLDEGGPKKVSVLFFCSERLPSGLCWFL
jgi:hypothetical protein